MMTDDIKILKAQYHEANSENDKNAVREQMTVLIVKDEDQFANAMLDLIKESNKKADEILLRQKLENILPIISVSYLAKNYFQKTPQWFYQRLNRNKVNGKESFFSKVELETLSKALIEISQKLKASAAIF